MSDPLPPARLRAQPGGSGYPGVQLRRVKRPKRVYWYWVVKEPTGRRVYYPYTVDGLQAAIIAATARG